MDRRRGGGTKLFAAGIERVQYRSGVRSHRLGLGINVTHARIEQRISSERRACARLALHEECKVRCAAYRRVFVASDRVRFPKHYQQSDCATRAPSALVKSDDDKETFGLSHAPPAQPQQRRLALRVFVVTTSAARKKIIHGCPDEQKHAKAELQKILHFLQVKSSYFVYKAT